MRWMAFLLSLACFLLATGHQVRCKTLLKEGTLCGDYLDGTWMVVKPEALEGPDRVTQMGGRVTSKASGPKFLQARLGYWSYQVLDVVMKNGSTKGLEVYMDPNWVAALPFLKNGTLSVDNLTDMSSLYGQGADVTDAAYAYRVKRLKPASGTHIIFVRNSGKAPVWVEDVRVCARQIDFSSNGQPITPRGVDLLFSNHLGGYINPSTDTSGTIELKASKQVLNKLRANQAGQFSRLNTPTLRAGSKCEGYDASCPDGKTCTGTYVARNCDSVCPKHDMMLIYGGECAPGDIMVDLRNDCGTKPGAHAQYICPPVPICGKCDACNKEFVRAQLISADYPSKATNASQTGSIVTDKTTVENCGDTDQVVTVKFTFKQNTITTAAFQKKDATSPSKSLDLKIPMIGADLRVTQGSTESISDGETTAQAATTETSFEVKVNMPPHVKREVTATMKTTSAKVKVPVRYNRIYTCDEVEEIDDVVTFSTTGLVAGSSKDIELDWELARKYC